MFPPPCLRGGGPAGWSLLLVACHGRATPASTSEDIALASSSEARVDAIARKCARITSCAHPHDAPRFRDPGRCVDSWLEHMHNANDPVPPCLLTADSCIAVEACLHAPSSESAATFCAAHPGMLTGCDGTTLVTCAKDDPTESTSTPCPSLGGTCAETHGAGGLVAHACINPQVCPPDVSRSTCGPEGAVVACHDTAIERTVCGHGTHCHAHKDSDGEEVATCEGEADVPCDTAGGRACRGARLEVCEVHGHHADEREVDCAALGMSCGAQGGRASCVSGAGQCEPGASRCEGGRLVFCAAGRIERIACEEVGLGACLAEGRGPVALCGAGRAPRKR